MHSSIEPRERRHVKGYWFLSFARNIGTLSAKVAKNMSNKYSQKLVDTAKKIYNRCNTDCFKKSYSKNSRSKGDLVGNKIADKITSAPKKSHGDEIQSNEVNNEILKVRYISPKERQKTIDELRLI